ncbi:2-succinyl-6-hydroxy-2,4-cyclohexadiene-1-carboxylate synthase [Bacillus sp. AGMB 02131]|uniref:Putative 2-succinyl-6-hydroxy-2,4-cyclohexadiene-1-carboxylate synthase n=1 Tax=Peribacillus faecalis TaxID=2772559 RepID=A0A927HDG4_9BACI|nr:2-succinyl-6-hydroxy-2,4-cyclohexadiene-1-carboxylate synthase [Peribacillus faecalis]MBD3110556.1 2-succinyl-6-hydroxy-2,4-cyclohexadiene-1-carboxylate synthase [Peribacillus faecalis]
MEINCNGVSYYVELYGKGEPLLLLHGFTGDQSTWSQLIQTLQENYLCIVPDLIGHGKSESPQDFSRYELKQVAADLKKMLGNLNIASCNVLGYSMGGRLALQFSVLYPESTKTLLLESASPGLLLPEERMLRKKQDNQLADRIEQEGIKAFVEYWQSIPLFKTQEKLSTEKKAAIYEQRVSNSELGLANSLRGMGTGMQQSLWEELTILQFPVLLLTGEYDEKFCKIAEKMSKMIPNCEWQTICEVGHAIHVEDSEMFGRIVSGFIENRKEREYDN